MQPAILAELMSMANSVLQGHSFMVNDSIFGNRDQSQISLTLKTYQTKSGLATKIHSTSFDEELARKNQVHVDELSTENAYYIKGPMGKGLQIRSSGIHVAFCAGTGALVFLDLVSHLLLKNCYEHEGKKLPNAISNMY